MFRRLLASLRRPRPDPEFDEEVREHLDLLAARSIARGVSPADAVRDARRQFGNAALLQDSRRDLQTFRPIETLVRAAGYALRQWRANPAFTAVAVLSLALGIGANTAVFTLLDQLVLRLLPVRDPARLVMIWTTGPHFGDSLGDRSASYPMCQDFQRAAAAFESVFCVAQTPAAVTLDGSAERVSAELVSGNFFQTLGVVPVLGRLFTPESDDRVYLGHPSVVLSYAYWMRRFAGSPAVLGRKILINGYPMEIVGVSGAGFTGLDPAQSPDLRVPILMAPVLMPGHDDVANRRSQWVRIFARLKSGYSARSAEASLQPLLHRILADEAEQPALRRLSSRDRVRFLARIPLVETAATGYSGLRGRYSEPLYVLMSMAALILLIACSNVASLLAARAAARQKEMAVRMAIGAGRRHVIVQLAVESLLLAVAGAAAGIGLAFGATRALLQMLPAAGLHAAPDARILAFGTGLALATALVFGLAPALHATRVDVIGALKDAVVAAGSSPRFRKSLVVIQVALSFLLLMGAGLFARTLANLRDTRTGIASPATLVSFQLDPTRAGYGALRTRGLYTDLLGAIRSTPGVQSAAYAMWPLLNGREWDLSVVVEGYSAAPGEDMQAYYNLVSPGYWHAMGIPLLAGRDFDRRDRVDSSPDPQPWTVAIVNRAFAEHYFGGIDAVGRRIGCCHGPGTTPAIAIVGVVENALFAGPRSGVHRQVFLPYLESATPAAVTFYARGANPAELRGAVSRLAPSLPVYNFKTLDAQLDETLATERLVALLAAAFALLATLLAALGLYGVTSFVVVRRTREIGLRMALGASRRSMLWMVFREVLLLLAAGLALGLPAAWVLRRTVSSQLYGVAATDPWTAAAALCALALVTLLASLIPVRRATAIDPLTALRYE
jgi:predicted permease